MCNNGRSIARNSGWLRNHELADRVLARFLPRSRRVGDYWVQNLPKAVSQIWEFGISFWGNWRAWIIEILGHPLNLMWMLHFVMAKMAKRFWDVWSMEDLNDDVEKGGRLKSKCLERFWCNGPSGRSVRGLVITATTIATALLQDAIIGIEFFRKLKCAIRAVLRGEVIPRGPS